MNSSVTLALRDLSEGRAQVIRRLNDANVPVNAWLVLPKAQGYFATCQNVSEVEARWREVAAWLTQQQLRVARVGLDFERDLRELDDFFVAPVTTGLRWALTAGQSNAARDAARERYLRLIAEIRAAGFGVETYQFPLLLDDQLTHGSFWQRLTGSLDVRGDDDVLMLYTSLLGRAGPGLLNAYVANRRVVGVGSTGGGVDPFPKLTWAELTRDLLLAKSCDEVRIFSLEGCVQQGFLERLETFDWAAHAQLSSTQRLVASTRRATAQLVSRAFSR
jgi:hypothetical protein